jgi:hypothetical protein
MNTLTGLLVASLALGMMLAADQGRGASARDQRNDDRGGAADRAADRSATQVTLVFSPGDLRLIRAHYESRYRSLPPGLQKKLARGGTLPPGWDKKMEAFPAALERDLVVLPGGHRRGVMDGHAVIYHPITHAILDIVSLF